MKWILNQVSQLTSCPYSDPLYSEPWILGEWYLCVWFRVLQSTK